jgi:plasmid stability protein
MEPIVADILIRKVDPQTKELLRRRASRRGRSLEGELRIVLQQLARSESESPDDTEPFGTWLVSMTRPGADLSRTLKRIRSARARIPDLR